MTTTGILLAAAGFGQRYRAAGGQGNKLAQRLEGEVTLFQQSLTHAMQSGLPVQVITRPEYRFIQQTCQQLKVPCEQVASQSLGETLAAGVRLRDDWHGWIVLLADMPRVSPEIILRVAQALQQHHSARPFWRGQPGHPVGFAHTTREALLQLSQEEGARRVLQQFPPYPVPCDDAGVIVDIDLPLTVNGAS
jgi:molybdenum cofactor cytidylyltransferase